MFFIKTYKNSLKNTVKVVKKSFLNHLNKFKISINKYTSRCTLVCKFVVFVALGLLPYKTSGNFWDQVCLGEMQVQA